MPPGQELVDRAMRLLLEKDMDGFAELWATNGVLEFAFAPHGHPQRLEGREAVRDYMRGYPDHIDLRSIGPPWIHRTTDPHVMVVEFEVDGIADRHALVLAPPNAAD